MKPHGEFDVLFQQAVTAIDKGNEESLQELLNSNPDLATERLRHPGKWLTTVIGDALKSFFKDPYLLWFVSEDAVRNKMLPGNIANIAAIIISKIKEQQSPTLKEQLDYTLKLIAWSTVARNCKVQIPLLDVLINEGAETKGASNDALVNGNFEAAGHLVKRGAKLSLPTALCLGYWDEADKLAATASKEQIQFSLILASLNGKPQAVFRALSYGADKNEPSRHLHPHGTPLHHAVSSGSLETVKLLTAAGANINPIDTAWNGTPLGWALYGNHKEIADHLKTLHNLADEQS